MSTPVVRQVAVWDVPTRLFHWALVVLIALLWWTAENDRIALHKLAGIAVACLLVFRIYWGFFGAETARFAGFLRGPRGIWTYLRGKDAAPLGHNPLGGWSVAALLIFLAIETGLGLFAIDEDGLEPGPLASFVSFDQSRLAAHWHAVLFNWLLALIGLHVAAVFFYLLRQQNLIAPMITGRKRFFTQIAPPAFASGWSLVIGVALAAATFGALWWLDNH